MDHHLFAIEMGVAEGGSHVDDGAGGVVVGDVVDGDESLHVGQCQGEEGGVGGADHEAVIAVGAVPGLEGQHDEPLGGEPVHGLPAQGGELVAEAVGKAGLVGGAAVADDHGVGVPAAHVVLHEVDQRAVLAADDLRLLHCALADDVVDYIVLGCVGGAEDQLVQLLLIFEVGDGLAFDQCLPQIIGQDELVEITVRKHRMLLHL